MISGRAPAIDTSDLGYARYQRNAARPALRPQTVPAA
jgi:hypothetical protein